MGRKQTLELPLYYYHYYYYYFLHYYFVFPVTSLIRPFFFLILDVFIHILLFFYHQ